MAEIEDNYTIDNSESIKQSWNYRCSGCGKFHTLPFSFYTEEEAKQAEIRHKGCSNNGSWKLIGNNNILVKIIKDIRDFKCLSNTNKEINKLLNNNKTYTNELKIMAWEFIKEHDKSPSKNGNQSEVQKIHEYLKLAEKEKIPNINFDGDIKGLVEFKKRAIEGVIYQYQPDVIDTIKKKNQKLKTTTLLNGDPGLGKTRFAIGVANELKLQYGDNLGVIHIELSKMMPKGVGESDIIHIIMDYIRNKNKPMFIIVDEAELLFVKRGEHGVMAHERASAMFSEFDGWKDKGTFPLYHFYFCTNKKADIDEAMLSRFSDTFDFQYYSDIEFIEIWKHHIKISTIELSDDEIVDIAYGCNIRAIEKVAIDLSLKEDALLKKSLKLTKENIIESVRRYWSEDKFTSSNEFINTKIGTDNYGYVAKDKILDSYHKYCELRKIPIDSDDMFWKKFSILRSDAKTYRPTDKETGKRFYAFKGICIKTD